MIITFKSRYKVNLENFALLMTQHRERQKVLMFDCLMDFAMCCLCPWIAAVISSALSCAFLNFTFIKYLHICCCNLISSPVVASLGVALAIWLYIFLCNKQLTKFLYLQNNLHNVNHQVTMFVPQLLLFLSLSCQIGEVYV